MCDLDAEIIIQSDDIRVPFVDDAFEINEGSFWYETSEAGWFSLNIVGPDRELSVFRGENPRIIWELSGEPLTTTHEEVDELEDIRTILDSETSEFSVNGIPEGEYTVDVELHVESVSDTYQEDIVVECGGVN